MSDLDHKESVMAHLRSGDSSSVKVTREIPMWGLITAFAAFVFQTVVGWQAQVAANENISRLVLELKETRVELRELNGKVGLANITDVKHDMLLIDVERRLQTLEGAKRP